MTFGEWALLLATWLVAGLLLGLAYHRVRTRDRLREWAEREHAAMVERLRARRGER